MPWGNQAHAPQLGSEVHMPTTTEACVPRACAPQQEKSPQPETHTLHLGSSTPTTTRKQACAQQQRPGTAKKKCFLFKLQSRK